jgi:LysR family transcriptional regulator, glycine cleavage system transcriptional activator
MNRIRHRPLSVGPIRALDAVARHLNFRAAAEELHLTQSAVSRQIRALEEEVGAPLFRRGTRHVELTADGATLLRSVSPWLSRLDATVRQIRQARGRRVVSVTTFASFATLWLIPRLTAFQQQHPDIDIRVGASDSFIDPEAGDAAQIDVGLRYCRPDQAPSGAVRLFDDVLTPVASPWLIERSRTGGPPLATPADLARHALMEEDDLRPSSEFLSWSNWLHVQGLASLQPARWLYFNFTHQQIQAALAGQGVALARLPLTVESLTRGELVELFPAIPGMRVASPYAYWMVAADATRASPEVRQFCTWIVDEAGRTREAIASLTKV